MFDVLNQIQRRARVKLLFSISAIFLICSSANSQIRPLPRPTVILQTSGVVLYEHSNFGGRSKTLGIGDHKLSDFNDTASSIKVSAGLVAVIYEHAKEAGGYGIWVDFLEDRADLSQFDFNDKASFVRVFATPDARKFIWARNSMQNGQFVAGHWERPRAGGTPVNSTAVVAPSLPTGGAAGGATTIQVNDAQSVITALGVQNSGDAALWETTHKDGMDVIGSDYRGAEEIGSAAFERDSNNIAIPDNFNMWYPQKQPRDHRNRYFKRTLSGIIYDKVKSYVVNIEGTYEDFDLTFNVKPLSKYEYLIRDAHPPKLSVLQAAQLRAENIGIYNPSGSFDNPCTEPFLVVHNEIDIRSANVKQNLSSMINSRIGKQISSYGPWIYDRVHCHHPEIHPAEQIWWADDVRTTRHYYLNVFADSSKRFWWRSQMDDGTKLKPWAAPPIKGVYAIAFETEIGKPAKKFEVFNGNHYNVITYPNANKIYNLVYQNNVLISFVPKNDSFKVSYEKVGLKPGTTNVIRGFLVLETSVGTVTQIKSGRVPIPGTQTPGGDPNQVIDVPQGADPNQVDERIEKQVFKKVEGYYMFRVTLTDPADPDYCVEERNNFYRLRETLRSQEELVSRMQADLRNAAPQDKPRISQEIRQQQAANKQLHQQVRQAEQVLQACEARGR